MVIRRLIFVLVCCVVVGLRISIAAAPDSQSSIEWEKTDEGETAFVPMKSAPFPHESREKGFVYNKVTISAGTPLHGQHIRTVSFRSSTDTPEIERARLLGKGGATTFARQLRSTSCVNKSCCEWPKHHSDFSGRSMRRPTLGVASWKIRTGSRTSFRNR